MTQPTTPDTDTRIDIRDLLNSQTGKLEWSELQRHFARGMVIEVKTGLDLIDVATRIIDDDQAQVEQWMSSGQLVRAETIQARDWEQRQPVFWSVVVAPWVLVQESENN